MHSNYPWIPGSDQIRPSPQVLEKKWKEMSEIEVRYESVTDFVYATVFSFPEKLGPSGRIVSVPSGIQCPQKVFAPNRFPYNVAAGSHHWLMWYTKVHPTATDEEVNTDIRSGLAEHLGHNKFEFVWYENPKMTVPDIYHVQTFWHETFKEKE
jgi:hypothetical protein